MKKITYVTGNDYCVLLIPKQKAEQLNIANSNEVSIKSVNNGIIIEKENAGTHNTDIVRVSADSVHVPTRDGLNVEV